jgi:uncharacterized protein YbjT (DUF2867 family)
MTQEGAMILLTGATGRVGKAAATELLSQGVPFRAFVRDADKFEHAGDGVEVVVGDFTDPDSVARAVNGVTRALIVMGNHPDQAMLEQRFATVAAEAGVAHLVKVSSMEAAPDATAALPKNHFETEQHIAGLDLDWTFLRPNYYMQNMLMYAASVSRASSFALPLGRANTAMIDARDVGRVAARVLSEEGHEQQIYRLTGPELLNFHDVAEQMSTVLQRSIEYIEQTPEAFREVLGTVYSITVATRCSVRIIW